MINNTKIQKNSFIGLKQVTFKDENLKNWSNGNSQNVQKQCLENNVYTWHKLYKFIKLDHNSTVMQDYKALVPSGPKVCFEDFPHKTLF